MHREEVILEEAGGILCDYRGHLITNLVAGKENIVHDLISHVLISRETYLFFGIKNLE